MAGGASSADGLGRAASGGDSWRSQGAGAGKKVQATRARHLRRKPVEQRLPNAIRRGAQAGDIGDGQFAAAPLAADDAQLARRRGRRRGTT